MTPDTRTRTEHDVDRLLYSDELRRLSGITQVLAVGETHLIHDRGAHTQKVAQLSRRIAERLNRSPENASAIASRGPIDVAAAEAAGLAHDLGHPPFGHAGEDKLDELLKRRDAPDGFEGNAQSLRIVMKSGRRGSTYGLGLSDVSLRAIVKYPWTAADRPGQRKYNAYATEAAALHALLASLPEGGRSIEASIMDWADDITYAVHDFEDFVRAGIVRIDLLRTRDHPFYTYAEGELVRKPGSSGADVEAALASFKRHMDTMSALARYDGSAEMLGQLRATCGVLIGGLVYAASVNPDAAAKDPITVEPAWRQLADVFKAATRYFVVSETALASAQLGQAKILGELVESLELWVHEEKTRTRLPPRLRDFLALCEQERLEGHHGSVPKAQTRAVVDFVCTLTEPQAISLHARLNGRAAQSGLNNWLTY